MKSSIAFKIELGMEVRVVSLELTDIFARATLFFWNKKYFQKTLVNTLKGL